MTWDGFKQDDVAQIVHDLKSPLATIALETDLLDEHLSEGDHARVKSAVGRITQNIAFLDRMVQDLLDLCSFDAGAVVLRRAPVELGILIASVIDRVVSTRDRHRIRFEGAAAATVSIDSRRIERVIANLLQNALKFAPAQSPIVVRLEQHAEVSMVSVIDSGPGLSPDEMAFVFDKFRRARSASAMDGAGLGLYVSRKIIEAHGGRIGVDSVRGGGARFYFELPSR